MPEGSMIYTPAGTPHSPRFAPDTGPSLLVERPRREGEIDRFQWFCPSCDPLLHEEKGMVRTTATTPCRRLIARFYDSEEFRTCKKCGTVMPKP